VAATVRLVEMLGQDPRHLSPEEVPARGRQRLWWSDRRSGERSAWRLRASPVHVSGQTGPDLKARRDDGRGERRGGTEAPAAPRHRSLRSRKKREAALAYLFILPALLIFSVFVFYPFLRNFKLALYENPPYPTAEPLRGAPPAATVLSSSAFLPDLLSTILFRVMVVPTGFCLGLALAVAAHRKLQASPSTA